MSLCVFPWSNTELGAENRVQHKQPAVYQARKRQAATARYCVPESRSLPFTLGGAPESRTTDARLNGRTASRTKSYEQVRGSQGTVGILPWNVIPFAGGPSQTRKVTSVFTQSKGAFPWCSRTNLVQQAAPQLHIRTTAKWLCRGIQGLLLWR